MTDKYFRHIYTKVAAVAIALFAGSCAEHDFDFAIPGEGTAEMQLSLTFNTFEDSGVASRAAAGNAISDIEDVSVMVFTPSGDLVTKLYADKASRLSVSDSSHRPSDPGYDNDDVRMATVPLSLPYGNYHIYAVANMGHPSSWAAGINTESEFRSMKFDWKSSDVRLNRQMSGIVTESPDRIITNRQAELVTINRSTAQLHCWLQRAASKATIAYDATALNDNIFIYIVSAQVRDIPLSCTMVEKNVPQVVAAGQPNLPAASCLTDGETISYLATAGDYSSSRVVLAKGTAYGGLKTEDELRPGDNVHTIAEESLFFYENMQGTSTLPDKHKYENFPSKDGMLYGTYLEVKAYYVNKSATNPSKGDIIYRYMLGMNDTNDFNAQRNTHYKVTLRFIGDANNPDWHIVYSRPTVPTVEVPTPLYISYLYNQKLDVPVVCYYDENNYKIKSVKTEIIENPYTHPDHYIFKNYSDWKNTKYGFLSLNSHNKTSIDLSSSDAYLGSVERTSFAGLTYDKEVKGMRLTVPVYTRPLNLMNGASSTSFSGNNHFTHKERKAKIRVTVKFQSLANSSVTAMSTTDVEIMQVKRVVNPKGCWRPHDSVKPFTFTIMEANGDATNISSIAESSVDYTPIRSNGPWTARVYTETYGGGSLKPGVDWIQISPKGANQWRNGPDAAVTGSTNSLVEFDFRPISTISAGQTRFGVIEVLYNDNNCRHLIFVCQGFGTVKMGSNNWMMGNLYSNGTEVDNPLLEGSMFKYGNAEYGIRSRNNYSMDSENRDAGPFKNAEAVTLYWAQRKYNGSSYVVPNSSYAYESYPSTFGKVKANLATGFTDAGLTRSSKDSGTYRVATYADYKELLDADRYGTLFGVLYGDELTATPTTRVDRYTDAGDASGMRGCFIYDRATGNHLFMPIGNTGNGRRKVYYNSNGTKHYGVLKYANRDALMDDATGRKLPLMYDIYRKPGALYWFQKYETEGGTKHYALDINYFTYLVNIYDTQVLYYYGTSNDSKYTNFQSYSNPRPSSTWADENSDAAFVRRIRVK